ncbi:EAL domain-containing protein [Paracoccus sp. TK19116]|uniref:EAL domain-containing protein n=1 Tax=Paracoccus albicereus TaxID=2922394 RepID=A0ABT1MV27_9RHOB|nr:EAL domain-containing protein [Paracoccus albicereus]MCQ0970711.1 EAL domain-containing protein [Paracoccus albicereus]
MRFKNWLARLRQGVARMSRQDGTDADRIALVLRLENVSLLGDYLGNAGFAHFLVQISVRMSRALRPHDPVQIAAPGVFSVVLHTGSEVEAMRIALRLQADCQTAYQVAGMAVVPILSGVLVQNNSATAVPTLTLVEWGRNRLDAIEVEQLGRIVLLPYEHWQKQPSSLPATVAEAVAEGQIEPWFQPQVCCNTGAVTGFEALARWIHPLRGTLTPAAFMAGMTALDHAALTLRMLRGSLEALATWDAEGMRVPTVSINISQPELSDHGFAEMVIWELDRMNIRPERLVVEVLESVGPINSCEHARRNLAQLADAGCRLDLDDFGTGYAGLDSIRHFGVHRIKIDRSFISGCDRDPGQQRMVLSILAMTERLGIATLAEGVETVEEHSFLAQIGCDEVQGYAIARPMQLDQTMDFLRDYAARQGDIPSLQIKRAG